MSNRCLGRLGPQALPLALGCVGMSRMHGAAADAGSIAMIHAALGRGINLFDTGSGHGSGHNEASLGRALDAAPRSVTDGVTARFAHLGQPLPW